MSALANLPAVTGEDMYPHNAPARLIATSRLSSPGGGANHGSFD